jgi:5-methylcytosine-specific restriction protein A
MKTISPANIDFRTQLTQEIDLVITAKAKAMNLDKAAIARDVLARWAEDEIAFSECLADEHKRSDERAARQKIQRRSLSRRKQNAVFARDGFKCMECRDEPGVEMLHIDHVVPVSAGGSDDLTNLRVLCATCNLRKANKIVAIADAGGRK